MLPLDRCSRCLSFPRVAPTPTSMPQGRREQTGQVDLRVDEDLNDRSTCDRAVERSFKTGGVELLEGAVQQCIDAALGVRFSLYPSKHEKSYKYRYVIRDGMSYRSDLSRGVLNLMLMRGLARTKVVGVATAPNAALSFMSVT
jgi:hypothetical protein